MQNVIPQQAVQQAQAAQAAQTPISINGVGAGVGTGSSVFIGSPQVVPVTESRNNNKVECRFQSCDEDYLKKLGFKFDIKHSYHVIQDS